MKLSDVTSREALKVMTIEYSVDESGVVPEPIIELQCRRADRSRRYVEIEGFYPHFCASEAEVSEHLDDLLSDHRVRAITGRASVFPDAKAENSSVTVVDDAPSETLNGHPLVKITTTEPKHVAQLRESVFDETWEADVFFTDRFIIDTGLTTHVEVPTDQDRVHIDDVTILDEGPEVEPRLCVVDIEVFSGDGFPDPTEARNPVTAITSYDSYDDEYYCQVLKPTQDNLDVSDSWESWDLDWSTPDGVPDDSVTFEMFDSEQSMLYSWGEWADEHEPDIYTGWNSSDNDIGEGFDYPYLLNRADKLNLWRLRELAYDNGAAFVTEAGSATIQGYELLDMLQAYKKTQIHEKRSYTLDYIAQQELGYGKEDVADLDEGWLHEPVEFMQYNIRDTQAVHEIERAKSVIEMYDHIRSITGASYTSIAESNIGLIDVLFLREARKRGYALPSATRPAMQYYWGAYVFDPVSGLHENVVYPDLSSLYPNLFRDMNASPETIIGFEDDLESSEYTEDDCYTLYVDPRDESEKRSADEPVREPLYVLRPEIKESFVREIVQDLIDMKYEYKKDEYSDEAYGAVKRITNCFTEDTEVVTPDGIVNIRDLDVGDTVYSVTNDGQRVEEKDVTDVWEYPEYTDELVTISNSHTDFAVTPNHELLVNRTEHTDSFEATMAGNLNEYTRYQMPSDWDYDHGSTFGDTIDLKAFIETHIDRDVAVRIERDTEYVAARHGTSMIPRYIDTDDFVELLGWYVTEGSTYDTGRGNKYVLFTQDVGPDADRIASLLDANLGNYWEEDAGSHSYKISSHIIGDLFEELCGKGSENKRLPEFVFEMSRDRKELLFDTLIRGDGDTHSGVRYTTVSPDLKDDFVKLCVHLGRNPRVREEPESMTNHLVYRIRCSQTANEFRMHRDGGTTTAENGVYCVTVEDNHTLLAGRNGNFQFVKQSVYGVMGDSNTYGTGFRLFDWRIAEAITLAGRDVIKHTADEFSKCVRERGYDEAEIVSGDTDACVCAMPSADDIDETLDVAREAADYVDSTYDEFMDERFGIRDNNMEVEIESYAERALFMDKKKRYAQWVRWDEGDYVDEIEIKGFELVRSDSAQITDEVQSEFIERVLRQGGITDDVASYLQGEWEKVIDGFVSAEEIGKPSGIKSDLMEYGYSVKNEDDDAATYVNSYTPQPHIRGARYANCYVDGEQITSGDKPLLWYVDAVTGVSDYPEVYDYDDTLDLAHEDATMEEIDRPVREIALNDASSVPDAIHIDYEKMAEKTIRDPIEPIVSVLGDDFDSLVEDGTQTDITSFM